MLRLQHMMPKKRKNTNAEPYPPTRSVLKLFWIGRLNGLVANDSLQ